MASRYSSFVSFCPSRVLSVMVGVGAAGSLRIVLSSCSAYAWSTMSTGAASQLRAGASFGSAASAEAAAGAASAEAAGLPARRRSDCADDSVAAKSATVQTRKANVFLIIVYFSLMYAHVSVNDPLR